MTVEYRVKSVERFIVTRHEDGPVASGAQQKGPEYASFDTAYEVATALARQEQEKLGLPPGDMGVIFPQDSVAAARGHSSAYRASVPEV